MKRTFKKIVSDKPRQIAFEVFSDVVRKGEFSNLILPKRLTESGMDSRDKAFTTELVYGSLRQLGRNDYIASKFSSRDWREVDPGIVDVIRLGAYQLFDMRVPDHASVDATVNLARKVVGESKASFVNALMRKLASQSLSEHLAEVTDDSVESLSIRFSHPEWIINSYRDSISELDELKALLLANNTPVSPTLVAWPGKSTQEDLITLGAEPTKYSKFGAKYPGIPNELALIKERRAGVQDEGSQLLASIFAEVAKDKEPWLDLCAGPGGKAALLSHLASGHLLANEISPIRADLIKKVVRAGTEVLVGDGREISVKANAILADVPCTGLGALRRRPEIRWRRAPSDLPSLITLQYQLAARAIEILPVDGVFAYATCSPHIAETSAQCVTFEKKFPIEKIDVAPYLPNNLAGATQNGYMQLWPHRHETDAMFLALYRKR